MSEIVVMAAQLPDISTVVLFGLGLVFWLAVCDGGTF